jgi:hypothetical protein
LRVLPATFERDCGGTAYAGAISLDATALSAPTSLGDRAGC